MGDRETLLRRYIGKTIQIIRPEPGERIRGVLKAVNKGRPAVLQLESGHLWLDPAGEVILPDDPSLRDTPALVCRLASRLTGARDVQLAYRTSGLAWSAVYSACFDETKGTVDLAASLVLRNDTEIAFEDAAWRFIATETPGPYAAQPDAPARMVEYRPPMPEPTASVPARDALRLPLLDARNLAGTVIHVFDALPAGPAVAEADRKLQRILLLANRVQDGATGLGAPLPSGKAKISRRHGSGILEPVGGQSVDFTDANGMLRLGLGTAPGLAGKRTHTPFVELADERAQEQEVTIRLENATSTPVRALVVEHPWGRWSIPSSTVPYQPLGTETITFQVALPARGEAEVRYKLKIAY
jgi:hypothetical protein